MISNNDKKLTNVDIDEIIATAIKEFKLSINKEINIEYAAPGSKHVVLSDRGELLLVMRNLLMNATQFFDSKGTILIVREHLKGKRRKDVTDFVKIGISVGRMGISKQMLDAILEKFQQIGDLLSIKSGRDGYFKLSYCKEIVKGLGGNLWINSQRQKGLTYYFTLPLIIEAEAEKPPTQKKKAKNRFVKVEPS